MALPGMKSTADFTADERPRNWREGILRLAPNAVEQQLQKIEKLIQELRELNRA